MSKTGNYKSMIKRFYLSKRWNLGGLLAIVLILAVVALYSFASPTASTEQPDIVINEIHYDPDIKTELVEFIELHNRSQSEVDLSHWAIKDAVKYLIPNKTIIPAGGYLVIAQNPIALQNKFAVTALGPYKGKLSTRGERIVLSDAAGEIIDEVTYELGFPWPIVGDEPGHSIELLNPALDNGLAGHWRSGGATPGAANSVFTVDSLPLIDEVQHAPYRDGQPASQGIVPTSKDVVRVTVHVTDPDGIATVEFYHQRVEPGSYFNLYDPEYVTNWGVMGMNDEGINGDVSAGDDIYTVELPESFQQHRHLIRYRIRVIDQAGHESAAPYPDDPQLNFAYFVYDGAPPWKGAIKPGDSGSLGELVSYDVEQMEQLPTYHFLSKRQDVADALFMPDSEMPEGYMGNDYLWLGTLVYNGEVYDHIRFRARGGWWRYATGKNMWKFDFLRGHYLQAHDAYGKPYTRKWDKLNLSAVIQQSVRGYRGEQGLFESVGYRLFNLAGVPAPHTHFLHFRVIDDVAERQNNQYEGDFWGLYLAVEQMDGRFLDEHGLPDGNLYKMEGEGGELNNQSATGVSDGSDLQAFMDAYQNNTPSEQWWREHFDLPGYYNFRAIVEAIHDYDINRGSNYFYYHHPKTNKWSILAWDIDQTWADNMYGTGEEPFTYRVLNRPVFNIEYQNRLRELRDLLYNNEQIDQLIDEYAAMIDDPTRQPSIVDADRAMWDYHPIMTSRYVNPEKSAVGQFYQRTPTKDFSGMVQLMKEYVTTRSAWIDNTILTDSDIPYTPTITYTGPANFPAKQLTFHTSPFSDPQGSDTFAAIKWRIGQISAPNRPNYEPNAPNQYEIDPIWESDELTTFNETITIPPDVIEPGHIYRVRVRMKDNTGRWSHWSEPVEFIGKE